MKTYTIQVNQTYVQVVDIKANSKEEAEQQALDEFDPTRANLGEAECWTTHINGIRKGEDPWAEYITINQVKRI